MKRKGSKVSLTSLAGSSGFGDMAAQSSLDLDARLANVGGTGSMEFFPDMNRRGSLGLGLSTSELQTL